MVNKGCWNLSCVSVAWRGRLTLLGSLFIHICLSTILVFGSIAPYFASYYRSFDKTLTMAKVMMVLPFSAATLAVCTIVALKIS